MRRSKGDQSRYEQLLHAGHAASRPRSVQTSRTTPIRTPITTTPSSTSQLTSVGQLHELVVCLIVAQQCCDNPVARPRGENIRRSKRTYWVAAGRLVRCQLTGPDYGFSPVNARHL
jgi:hypothetical protein